MELISELRVNFHSVNFAATLKQISKGIDISGIMENLKIYSDLEVHRFCESYACLQKFCLPDGTTEKWSYHFRFCVRIFRKIDSIEGDVEYPV